ncbi:leucine-rich repeat, cysteine-containing subtype protein [Tanacetum coccineum]
MVVCDSDLKRLAKTRGGSLRSLEIWGCKMFSKDGLEDIARAIDEDQDYIGFSFPPNIRGLRIENLTEALFPFLLPYLNQLRELDLECIDKGLKVIGQFCKKLRKLTHHGLVTQKGLIAVAQGCPNLEYLEVYISDISNKALECVGTFLKNLLDFRISLDEEGGYVGAYGHNLRHLSLSYTGESDVGLLELLKGCPKLRKLKLTGCLFSKQAITTFVFGINQSLRYVWLDYGFRDVSVLTRPVVSAEVLTKLYLKLAETLHRLALQLVADGSDAGSVKITYTSSRVTADIDTPLIRNMVANSIQNEERDTLGETSEKPLEIIVRIANVESRFTSAVCEAAPRKQAVMVIAVDEKPSLKKIDEIPAVEEFVFVIWRRHGGGGGCRWWLMVEVRWRMAVATDPSITYLTDSDEVVDDGGGGGVKGGEKIMIMIGVEGDEKMMMMVVMESADGEKKKLECMNKVFRSDLTNKDVMYLTFTNEMTQNVEYF